MDENQEIKLRYAAHKRRYRTYIQTAIKMFDDDLDQSASNPYFEPVGVEDICLKIIAEVSAMKALL